MKKMKAVAVFVFLAVFSAGTAYADVILSPLDNPSYIREMNMLKAYIEKDAVLQMTDSEKKDWQNQREIMAKNGIFEPMTALEYMIRKNMTKQETADMEKYVSGKIESTLKEFLLDAGGYTKKYAKNRYVRIYSQQKNLPKMSADEKKEWMAVRDEIMKIVIMEKSIPDGRYIREDIERPLNFISYEAMNTLFPASHYLLIKNMSEKDRSNTMSMHPRLRKSFIDNSVLKYMPREERNQYFLTEELMTSEDKEKMEEYVERYIKARTEEIEKEVRVQSERVFIYRLVENRSKSIMYKKYITEWEPDPKKWDSPGMFFAQSAMEQDKREGMDAEGIKEFQEHQRNDIERLHKIALEAEFNKIIADGL